MVKGGPRNGDGPFDVNRPWSLKDSFAKDGLKKERMALPGIFAYCPWS